jgi:predicted lipoprotein with Yx(FWY)xxD motif
MMKNRAGLMAVVLALLLLAACSGQTATPASSPERSGQESGPVAVAEEDAVASNSVSAGNQMLGVGNSVTVDTVISDTPGWLVIHAQAGDQPGPVLGQAAVEAGESEGVVVTIDPTEATGTLYAMLHVDAGTIGSYEFPGEDVPAIGADGKIVTFSFDLVIPTALLSENEQLGQYLVGGNGMTLYLFTNDEPNLSNCTGGCAAAWPPLLIEDGATPVGGEGVLGALGITEREDGARQVTYNGFPLYYWASDVAPGDTTGHGVNDVWFVVDPALAEAIARPDLMLGNNDQLGDFLAGANGMTLYLFTKDDPDKSVCYGGCAEAWPPLLVAEGTAPTAEEGIPGVIGTTVRDDGTTQATYNGYPLYFWASDGEPGDTTGHGVNDVWFVVDPAMAMATPNADLLLGEKDELGPFLVDADGMTLYLFTRDEPGASNCTDGCAEAWPPLLIEDGKSPVAGEGLPGALGTTERDDGTVQITYNGSPLYYWVSDMEAGDTTGHGVNDVWFVVDP